MKSIQTKIIFLIVIAIAISSILIGGIGTYSFHEAIDSETVRVLNWTCKEKAQELNNIMGRIEQSVQILSVYALENLESVDKLFNDPEYLAEYEARLDSLGLTIANETEGAAAVYIRFNPDLTTSKSGFFRVKNAVTGKYESVELTDFDEYDPSDVERLGWYYIPAEAGKPVWMDPYHNKNIDVYMISYVIPIYMENQLIGVVGMDINFEYVIEQIESIQIYETGHAFITDDEFYIVYSRHYAAGTSVKDYSEDFIYEEVEDVTDMDTLYEITLEGTVRKVAFSPLANNMFLAVIVPDSELDVTKDILTTQIIVLAGVVVVIFIIVAWIISKSVVKPLRHLNEAAQEIANGNLNVSLDCNSKDEIGTLTESLKETVAQLKIRINYINHLAYEDKLTGVNNNTAYLHEVTLIKNTMEKEDCSYAVFVIDVNGLKAINDVYGHAAGNELIIAASKVLTDIFGKEQVYRIGGDEFAIILKDVDEATCKEFENRFNQSIEHKVGNVKIAAAIGSSVYDKTIDISYENVFQRADDAMYKRKVQMKEHGENSIYFQ